MKIAYLANYREISGYSEAARGYINALNTTDIDVATRNIAILGVGEVSSFDNEKNGLDNVDVAVYHTLPDFYQRAEDCKNVGIFCWETTKLPDRWVKNINKELDAVVVFNECEKYICEKNGIKVPVYVVSPAIEVENKEFKRGTINSDITNDETYVFYNITDFNARKNLDDLLTAYLAEFRSSDNCILFLHIPCGNDVDKKDKICGLIEYTKNSLKINDYAKVFLSYNLASDKELYDIHCSGDTFISLSHGESWNIPMFNAYVLGNRIIFTECAGPIEYLDIAADNCDVYVARGDLSPVSDMFSHDDEMYVGNGMWIEPRIKNVMEYMRKHFSLGRVDEKIYKKDVAEKYSFVNIGKKFKTVLEEVYCG